MQNYLALIFVITIGMNIMCALLITFSKLKNFGQEYSAVLACCILIGLFQYANWQYHMSSEFEQSVFWLKTQSSLVLLSIIPFAAIYALWCDVKNAKYYYLLFLPFILVLLAVNIIQPYGMRFNPQDAPTLVEFTLFGSEPVHRLNGSVSNWMAVYIIFCIVAIGILITWINKNRQKLPTYVWLILLSVLALQVIATVLSGLTDKGVIESVYLGGLPFTLLNILCCIRFSSLLAQKSSDLETLVYKSAALEKILVSISGSAANMPINEFFKKVIVKIQEASGATTGIILVYDGSPEKQKVKTAIAVHQQNLIENFSFSMSEIPDDFRDPNHFHIVSSGLYEKYPKAEFYRNIKAQAMISVPMFNQAKEAIGVLSLYFRKPSRPDYSFVNVVRVCASRLATEYERELLLGELEEIAYLDFQTKLPNLVHLNKTFQLHVTENSTQETSSIIIKIDIDGFADLNRKYGFENAEEILKILGKRFKEYSSDEIFIARTGGDEFTFVLLKASENLEALVEIHWQALQSLVQQVIKLNSLEITLQCSGGSVIYPQQVPTEMEPMRCAEFALRQAKINGKNRLQSFDAHMIEHINRQKLIEKELRAALTSRENSNMFLVYQPKVESNGKPVGSEALSRWTHPTLGNIPPLEFIAIAESCGLIDELGLWCIEEVCNQLATWRASDFVPPGRVAINVSAQQFEDETFIDKLLSLLAKYDINPTQLDLELTESSLMQNIHRSIQTMKILREKEFSISLDDFGTGYSSLSYLKDLPLDNLKIDRSFVIDSEKENSLHLLQSILSLGKNMKLKTIAEGVEEKAQVTLLEGMGCDVYQGYLYSKPLSASEFKKWVADYYVQT